ncbi:hypothetical protein VNO77_27827 [Canavalia gladiata]|uniref:Uncharacterized protein n=1 Tax=Canavalia gladiata TaxID=3824 RepID=A0AAN9KYJ6_CANGL
MHGSYMIVRPTSSLPVMINPQLAPILCFPMALHVEKFMVYDMSSPHDGPCLVFCYAVFSPPPSRCCIYVCFNKWLRAPIRLKDYICDRPAVLPLRHAKINSFFPRSQPPKKASSCMHLPLPLEPLLDPSKNLHTPAPEKSPEPRGFPPLYAKPLSQEISKNQN